MLYIAIIFMYLIEQPAMFTMFVKAIENTELKINGKKTKIMELTNNCWARNTGHLVSLVKVRNHNNGCVHQCQMSITPKVALRNRSCGSDEPGLWTANSIQGLERSLWTSQVAKINMLLLTAAPPWLLQTSKYRSFTPHGITTWSIMGQWQGWKQPMNE